MEKRSFTNTLKNGIVAAAITLTATTGAITEANAQTVKNVVLVHGAFADGSGYKGLYEVLTQKGIM